MSRFCCTVCTRLCCTCLAHNRRLFMHSRQADDQEHSAFLHETVISQCNLFCSHICWCRPAQAMYFMKVCCLSGTLLCCAEAKSVLQAYFMLDEMLLAGELQEPSKKVTPRSHISSVHACASVCSYSLAVAVMWMCLSCAQQSVWCVT